MTILTGESRLRETSPMRSNALFRERLGNAWKFTEKKPGSHIRFTSKQSNTRVYSVSDDGAGFDPAGTKKLFRPFQRLHTPGEFSGTGIGLATVQRIVELHGGEVWAEGKIGEGTTFYFTLPDPMTRHSTDRLA